ncbi:epoxide hydrolase family protein [Catenuloplanes atrovinosus]|uniref:Pimeloyl-ACP methyl ester carboxylesterase n=1 Tax=Catenuloplanes atrovinosus TaxID=137266 RepID=A0AAE4CAY2_9ACTN|nr:epoxide hydrolase [Catenuloplanes atrovinosus]MDR7275055.1 pimeloyl-ACP methyl ester carboxylesterase [Catenuloplanes atrovinosus]
MLEPFALHVSDHDLADLRRRLRETRPPAPIPHPGWIAGADAATVARLVRHWAGDFDWRAREAEINALPQFTADVGGTRVHLVRLRGEGPEPLPIVLTHGWPSTFLELTALGDRLARPGRYGGDPADAFDVVIPSLPGFAFSAPSRVPTHELWHTLMHDVLGYRRYGAHGGDLGAGVSSRLAAYHPEAVVGLHLLAAMAPPDGPVTDEERAHVARTERWDAEEGGYQHLQRTRPLTPAHALSDSPAGLLAWIAEKYRAWSDAPDAFSDDELLTQVSLYWFTNTIATSFLPYYDHRPFWRRIEVPTGIAVFPHDLARPPRSWVERTYRLSRYTAMPRGGHFAAHEEPALLAADLTAFFRQRRTDYRS